MGGNRIPRGRYRKSLLFLFLLGNMSLKLSLCVPFFFSSFGRDFEGKRVGRGFFDLMLVFLGTLNFFTRWRRLGRLTMDLAWTFFSFPRSATFPPVPFAPSLISKVVSGVAHLKGGSFCAPSSPFQQALMLSLGRSPVL